MSMKSASGSNALCKALGHVFTQPQLLQRALTHRSYAPEHNERLEFLGDSILGCVIAKYLYVSYPHLSEGELSRLRSNLVKEDTLVILAQQLSLGNLLKLGEGSARAAAFDGLRFWLMRWKPCWGRFSSMRGSWRQSRRC